MTNKPEFQEQLGPQARLEAELFKLESQRRELWVLIIFTVVVMVLGGPPDFGSFCTFSRMSFVK